MLLQELLHLDVLGRLLLHPPVEGVPEEARTHDLLHRRLQRPIENLQGLLELQLLLLDEFGLIDA
jgi:hypothetical protein